MGRKHVAFAARAGSLERGPRYSWQCPLGRLCLFIVIAPTFGHWVYGIFRPARGWCNFCITIWVGHTVLLHRDFAAQVAHNICIFWRWRGSITLCGCFCAILRISISSWTLGLTTQDDSKWCSHRAMWQSRSRRCSTITIGHANNIRLVFLYRLRGDVHQVYPLWRSTRRWSELTCHVVVELGSFEKTIARCMFRVNGSFARAIAERVRCSLACTILAHHCAMVCARRFVHVIVACQTCS